MRRLWIGFALVLLLRQLWWAVFGKLNVDEFEEVHVLWLLEQGIWPYRDYLHTHLPAYHVLLYPLYAAVGPSVELPGLVRLCFLPWVVAIVYQVGWIARAATGRALAGWLAVVLFLASPRIGRKLAEARPDLVGIALLLLGLVLLIRYLRDPSTRARSFYGCAAVLGLSLLFSRKSALLVLLLVFFAERYECRLGLAWGPRLRRMGGFAALLVGPFAAVVLLLVAAGISTPENLRLFVTGAVEHQVTTFFVDLKWDILTTYLPANAVLVVLGLLGAVQVLAVERTGFDPARPGLSLLAVYALLSLGLLFALPILLNHLLILPAFALCVLAAWVLSRARPAAALLGTLSAVVLANALDADHYELRTRQMGGLRLVQEAVPEGVPVLDTFSGYGIFRPFVGRFLYYRPLLVDSALFAEQTALVRDALERGAYGAVIDLFALVAAPPEIRALVAVHYEPTPDYPEILLPRDP